MKGQEMLNENKHIDYCTFMRGVTYADKDYNKCDKCGGTGLIAITCCSGLSEECGCMGMPTDFEKCSCGCDELTEQQILDYAYKFEVKNGFYN